MRPDLDRSSPVNRQKGVSPYRIRRAYMESRIACQQHPGACVRCRAKAQSVYSICRKDTGPIVMQTIVFCRFSYPAEGGFQVEHDSIDDRAPFFTHPDAWKSGSGCSNICACPV